MSNNKKEFSGIVYMFTNNFNNKKYIGLTVNETRRYNEHKKGTKGNKEKSIFHKAIDKYGFNNFSYKVLFRIVCDNLQDLENTLSIKEMIAIKYYNTNDKNSGYNITKGGQGRLGYVMPEEVKLKISKSHTGKRMPRYAVEKVANALRGRHLSEEVKKKVSEASTRNEGVEILQFTLDGIFISSYRTIAEASRKTGISEDSIRGAHKASKKSKSLHSADGYIFISKELYEDIKDKIEIKVSKSKYIVEKYDLNKTLINTYQSPQLAAESLNMINITGQSLRDAHRSHKYCNDLFEYKGYLWKFIVNKDFQKKF